MRKLFFYAGFALLLYSSIRCAETPPELNQEDLPENLADLIPADLQYKRDSIPDDQNGFSLLVKACASFIRLKNIDRELQIQKTISNHEAIFPDGEAGRDLVEWIQQNKDSLALLKDALARNRIQFPTYKPTELFNAAIIRNIRDLARLLRIKFVWHISKQEDAEALGCVKSLLALGEQMIAGDGNLGDQIRGQSIAGYGYSCIEIALRKPNASDTLLSGCLGLLDREFNSLPGFQQCVRIEFKSHFGTPILSLPKKGSALSWSIGFLNALSEKPLDQEHLLAFGCIFAKSKRIFSPKETLALAAKWHAEIVRNAQLPYRDRNVDAIKAMGEQRDKWSETSDLFGKFVLSLASRNMPEASRQKLKELADWAKKDGVPLISQALSGLIEGMSKEEIEKLAESFAKEDNGLGKMWLSLFTQMLPRCEENARRSDAERGAMRLLLALSIYERKHSALPETLDELVETKIIKNIPADPFSGEPMKYSAQKRQIWSVGSDGKDDAGMGEEKDRWDVKAQDAVWRLPEIKAK